MLLLLLFLTNRVLLLLLLLSLNHPAASIPVVGFNAVMMSEHFASFLVAAVMHAALAVRWVKALLPPRQFEYATRLVLLGGACGLAGLVLMMLGYVLRSPTFGWTGRQVLTFRF